MALRLFYQFLGSSLGNHLTPIFSTFGSNVNDVVHGFDNIQIVFDDQYRIAFIYQFVEHQQQNADVLKMQSRGRFVQNVEGIPCIALREFGSEFDALRFPRIG